MVETPGQRLGLGNAAWGKRGAYRDERHRRDGRLNGLGSSHYLIITRPSRNHGGPAGLPYLTGGAITGVSLPQPCSFAVFMSLTSWSGSFSFSFGRVAEFPRTQLIPYTVFDTASILS